MDNYQEVFDIAGGFLKRICSKTNAICDKNDVKLDALAFFVFCYSIKDYIKNDTKIDSSIKNKVEIFVNNNDDLKFCKAIANREKHLEYKVKYTNLEVNGINYHQDVHIGGPDPSETFRYTVTTGSGDVTRDAVEIAYNSYKAWGKFFSDNNLPYLRVEIKKPNFTYYKTLTTKIDISGSATH